MPSDLIGDWGKFVQAFAERFQKKSGSTGEDGIFPGLEYFLQDNKGIAFEIARAVRLVDRKAVDKMMFYFLLLLRGGFCGADIHLAIELAAVSREDFGREMPRQADSQLRFAASGRSPDDN